MNNRTIFLMTTVVFGCIAILFLLNFMAYFQPAKNVKQLSQNQVRGVSLNAEGVVYTLNFEQQKQFISWLNRTIPVNKVNPVELPVHQITISRFKEPSIEVELLGVEGKQLIFSIPEWNGNYFLKDVSDGELYTMLMGAIDHAATTPH